MSGYYLYGGGIYCKAVINSVRKKPEAILDINLHGSVLLGVPILHPEDLSLNKNIPIYNTILGYGDVVGGLCALGFSQVVDTYETFSIFPESLSNLNSDGEFWRVPDKNIRVDNNEVEKLKNILSDKKSQETLNSLVEYRIKPCASTYPWPEKYDMYFPDNVPGLYQGYDQFKILDCGAFDGDTAVFYNNLFPGKIEHYVAVEPSPTNINSLCKTLASLTNINNAMVVQKGLGAEESVATLSEAGSASVISGCANGERIEITTIENIVESTNIDFNIIKVDIEGYDREAVSAALGYIYKNTPTLCLSVYHYPEDLWAMALDVYSAVGNRYRYYLRNEGHWGYETILYCVPNEVV